MCDFVHSDKIACLSEIYHNNWTKYCIYSLDENVKLESQMQKSKKAALITTSVNSETGTLLCMFICNMCVKC